MTIKPRPAKKPLQSTASKPSLTINIDLEKLFAAAIANDADEIVLRISQYDQSLEPANYQAIVRFSDRTRLWACVVDEKPHIAFVQALLDAGNMPGPTKAKRVKDALDARGYDSTGLLRGESDSGKQSPPSEPRKPARKIIRRAK